MGFLRVLVLLASACTSSAPPATADDSPVPVAADEPAPAIEPAPREVPSPPAVGADLSGPLRFSPVEAGDGRLPAANMALVTEDLGTMMDPAFDFGWSRDGKSFGWCRSAGGNCPSCVIAYVEGGSRSWEHTCPKTRDGKAMASAWAEHGFGQVPIPATWKFGRDVTIVWKYVSGREGPTADDPVRLSKLRIGAKVGDAKRVLFLEYEEPEMRDMWAAYDFFPEVVLPAPDGEHLGVLTHAYAGEHTDTFRMHFERTDDFAFAAYEKTGLATLRSHPARAAELFATAASLKPDAWKPHYNLACAQALAGHAEEARTALLRALELGGAKVADKARRDSDLRAQPWLENVLRGDSSQ
jgi:hypothetical protein